MKKWTSVLLGTVLIASITACGKEGAQSPAGNTATEPAKEQTAPAESIPTAKELIEKVTAAGQEMKSLSMDSSIKQDITINANGTEQTQKVNMDMKVDMVNEPFAMYQEMTVAMPDSEPQDIKQYITSEGVYTNVDGSWVKLPDETAAPILEQMKAQGSPEEQLKQLESIIDDVKVTDEGEHYKLAATVSGDKVKELAKGYMEQSSGGDASTAAMLDQMDINSMNMSYNIDKKTNFPVDFNVIMDMGMEMEGQKMQIKMDMQGKMSNFNKVEVTIPEEVRKAK